ncbi:hypothetical protein FOYG_15495 [Fusarium oxysporum NRRL 32931]|uniref:Uncharacterized protein n=1 Tax=Fusarium oxysporum NRRL 32931 TaxID=660029 RepID=W9HJV7_FUSOX|nr:hypothetical protein FOYG_15495 [Fusarium oxysporum NRRL 32931]
MLRRSLQATDPDGKIITASFVIWRWKSALRLGGLHDEWLKAIRWQAKKVLEKTEP